MFWKTYLQPIKFVSFLSSKESCKEKNTVFVQWIAQWWIISNKEPSCNQDALAKETSIIKISRLIEYNLIVWLDNRITQKKTFLFQIFSKVHKYNDFLFSLFSIFFLLHFFSIIFSPKILKFPYFVKPHIDLILSRRTRIDLVSKIPSLLKSLSIILWSCLFMVTFLGHVCLWPSLVHTLRWLK